CGQTFAVQGRRITWQGTAGRPPTRSHEVLTVDSLRYRGFCEVSNNYLIFLSRFSRRPTFSAAFSGTIPPHGRSRSSLSEALRPDFLARAQSRSAALFLILSQCEGR